MRFISTVMLVVVFTVLVACGGGGSSAPPTPPPPQTLQPQTIAFAQSGTMQRSLVEGGFTNVASGGSGTGAIAYSSSNTGVATVGAGGVVTLVAAGSTQISAAKAADATYAAANANYVLNVTSPGVVQFSARVGEQDSQVSFSALAQGLQFLRSTQLDCNPAQIASCTDGASDVVGSSTILDNAATLSRDATYWLRRGNVTSTATRISQQRFLGRASAMMVSFKGKLLLVGGQQTDIALRADVWSSEDGITWTLETDDAGFAVRGRHQLLAYNDRLWVIAGNGSGPFVKDVWRNDVWSSADGINWTQATAQAAFPGRILPGAVVFDGRMWVIGGATNSTGGNDVWSSTDGVAWTRVTAAAAFGFRAGHTVTVFNNKMWLIGGGGPGEAVVWSSADGANWAPEAMSPPFGKRALHVAAALNGRLWVTGGETDTAPYLNDVWSSPDGVNWIQESAGAAFAKRKYIAGTVHNGRMWVATGELLPSEVVRPDPNSGVLLLHNVADVWSSANGVDWTQMTPYAPFFPGTHNVQTLAGKLWVIGGSEGWDGSATRNDVWSSTNGSEWQRVQATQTFPAREGTGVTAFQNRLWVTGGTAENALLGDVWHSDDGSVWTKDSDAAAFGARVGHNLVVFNNQMLLIGGFTATGVQNDVWASSDGIAWTQLTASAAFPARVLAKAAVLNNRVWLLAGSAFTDAWSSADGVNWQLATANVPHLPNGGTALGAHNGKLWLTGGFRLTASNGSGEAIFSNDIWSSADGAAWTKLPDSPRFTPRSAPSLVEFNNALWLIGGNDRYGPTSDVWTSADGAQWRVAYSGSIAYP